MYKCGMGWAAIVTLSGGYVHDELYCPTWREAYDWACNQVKGWRA